MTAPSANAFATGPSGCHGNARCLRRPARAVRDRRSPVGQPIVQSDAPADSAYSATAGHLDTGERRAHADQHRARRRRQHEHIGRSDVQRRRHASRCDGDVASRLVLSSHDGSGGGDRHGRRRTVLGQALRRRSGRGVVGHQCAVHIPVGHDEDRRRQSYRRRLGDGQPESHGDIGDPARDGRQCGSDCGHVPAAGKRSHQRADAAPGSSVRCLRSQVGSVHGRRRCCWSARVGGGHRSAVSLHGHVRHVAACTGITCGLGDRHGQRRQHDDARIRDDPDRPDQISAGPNFHSIAPPDGYSITTRRSQRPTSSSPISRRTATRRSRSSSISNGSPARTSARPSPC